MKKPKTDPLLTLPRHLSVPMRKWVGSILDRFLIAPEHFKVLIVAAESWDLAQKCRAALAKHGATYVDRFGAPRMRPECAVLRDSRISFLRALRELSLENEQPDDSPSPRVAPTIPRKKGQRP